MKKFNLILLFIFLIISLNAQSAFRIKVIDSETKDGIDNALVFIEELGVPDQETDEFGIVSYQNIPENLKVKVNVRKKGYVPVKVDVVASRSINVYNNKVVELQKEPTTPQIIIYGEVIDKNGEEVKGATVEVSILGKPYKDVTDESGNYQIKIDGEVAKSISSFKIEVKKNGCEKFTSNMPKQDIINKDIRIICEDPKPIQVNLKPEPTPEEIRKAKEEQDRLEEERLRKLETQRLQNEEHKKEERKKELKLTVDYLTSILDDNHAGPFLNKKYKKSTDDLFTFNGYDNGLIKFTTYCPDIERYYDCYDIFKFNIKYINNIEAFSCENGICWIRFTCINSGCISLISISSLSEDVKKRDAYSLGVYCNESTQKNLIDALLKFKRLIQEE